MTRKAACLVIGNEILSGKIAEANVQPLAKLLRGLGIDLVRVATVQDNIDIIAEEVRALGKAHAWVFTSGGVGPTHDDVTIAAVAKAFDRPVSQHPELSLRLQKHFGERITPGHLRMALVPFGATLEWGAHAKWPAIRVDNVWVLPGVPEAFRLKLEIIRDVLRREEPNAVPFHSFAAYVVREEAGLVAILDELQDSFADVMIGSYPTWSDDFYKTKVTFDSQDQARAKEAYRAFTERLEPKELVETEG